MSAETRQLLGNGAHLVRPYEIAELRASQTPIIALVAPAMGMCAVATTIILKASGRPSEETIPNHGLACVQGRSAIVNWRLRAGVGTDRWIEGYIQRS